MSTRNITKARYKKLEEKKKWRKTKKLMRKNKDELNEDLMKLRLFKRNRLLAMLFVLCYLLLVAVLATWAVVKAI